VEQQRATGLFGNVDAGRDLRVELEPADELPEGIVEPEKAVFAEVASVFRPVFPSHAPAPFKLYWAQANSDVAFLPTEIVLNGGSVPAPSLVAGPKSQKPLRALLAPRHHVGEVLHDPAHVFLVNVRKEALVNRHVAGIFENPTSGPGQGLNVSLSVKSEKGNGGIFLLSEALPSCVRKKWR